MQFESKTYHIVKADSQREGLNTIRFKGADFTAVGDFKAKLSQYRLLFFGGGYDLALLAKYLFKKKPIKVGECQALGYDQTSNCYVYSEFLYDSKGKFHSLDSDGYFHTYKLKPFHGQDKSIKATGNK